MTVTRTVAPAGPGPVSLITESTQCAEVTTEPSLRHRLRVSADSGAVSESRWWHRRTGDGYVVTASHGARAGGPGPAVTPSESPWAVTPVSRST